MTRRSLALSVAALLGAACAGSSEYIRGTSRVEDNAANRRIIDAVEGYRLAMEKKDAPALMAMASKDYWEDGGTPSGSDDYGYDGLRQVLTERFPRADEIRYSLHYMDVKRQGNRAYVEVLIDASYSIQTAKGKVRQDMKDQNQMVLEWDGQKWLFLSGM